MIGYPVKSLGLVCVLGLAAGPLGCVPANTPQPRTIKVVKPPPLEVVRVQLEQYAAGQPVDSERDLYPGWVSDVRAVDPQAADSIQQCLQQIAANPAQARVIAKTMLEKLPKESPPAPTAARSPPPAGS
jgi:hypothetical protein